MNQREQIAADPMTINLKAELYAIRNKVLDYLVEHEELNQEMTDHLNRADELKEKWLDRFFDYLVTYDNYYSQIIGKILEPVHLLMNDREGLFDDMEMEIEKAIEQRDELVEKLETLRSNVNHYFGCFGGCAAWEEPKENDDDIPINPELPEMFEETANEERPDSHKQWWYKPFIQTDNFSKFVAPKDPIEAAKKKKSWYAEYPTGIRYNVRCLDGGAWDRSTNHGFFNTLEAAIEKAQALKQDL